MSPILIFFNCYADAVYAIDVLQSDFLSMGLELFGSPERIHFAFTRLAGGEIGTRSGRLGNVVKFDSASRDRIDQARIEAYVRHNRITMAFGVDQPVARPGYAVLRRAGVRRIVSYYGAPMSSVNGEIRLFLKRLEVLLRRKGPDHYIFESDAMARTATHGRGIPRGRTSVISLGVDTDFFSPVVDGGGYLSQTLGVPEDRKVVVYAGHMEERKGVRVIIDAASELIERRGRRDVHFLPLGNRPGEEAPYVESIRGSTTVKHVTFGGYRRDIALIFPRCHLGVIASTGWDSFTASAVEKAASGLPLVVSALGGLVEAVESGVTGLTSPSGNPKYLADRLQYLLDDEGTRCTMSKKARQRAVEQFSKERRIKDLAEACQSIYGIAPEHAA